MEYEMGIHFSLKKKLKKGVYGFMVFNISIILWHSVLLVDETGVPREYHQPAASHWQTL